MGFFLEYFSFYFFFFIRNYKETQDEKAKKKRTTKAKIVLESKRDSKTESNEAKTEQESKGNFLVSFFFLRNWKETQDEKAKKNKKNESKEAKGVQESKGDGKNESKTVQPK